MSDSASGIFTGERFIPGVEDKKLEIEHFQRYKSISGIVKGKYVIDAACGEGYGSRILADSASKVIGIDIDAGTIDRASKTYASVENLSYIQGSIANLSSIEDKSVDIVVSFETIEHVNEEIQNHFLEEIFRVLKSEGILVMSTPNKEIYSDLYNYHNEFHIKEFYKDEFVGFLKKKFENIQLYNQYFEVTSIIDKNFDEESELQYYKNLKEYDYEGKYFIALASNVKLPSESISSVFMNSTKEYEANIHRIIELQDDVVERNEHIKRLDCQIEKIIDNLNDEVRKIEQYENIINKYKERIEFYKQTVLNKEGHIELLLDVEREYERLKGTKAYKLVKAIQKAANLIMPPDSKRRFFARVLFNLVKNPKLMLNVISIKRIKHFFKYLKKEGMKGVALRYEEAVELEKAHVDPSVSFSIDINNNQLEDLDINDYEPLWFEEYDKPLVSIIIPVYNQFGYTYNCLKSIQKNSGDIKYEVIIADDCSSDATKDIKQAIEGLVVMRNEENLRFLKNCNNAAKNARGKYIVFLNNDTQVQNGWLSSMVRLMEENEEIGLTGSKLVYGDGRLQEAGGIFWNDASAWNYGNRANPEEPEYNYLKEVDYISGASIMIRKTLWEEIGGFDERFAPAYYEDSDLAFEVRKRGYKVVYQPLSVVVHFEGVSNGTDISSGQKAYQAANKDKFYEKWKGVLEKDHFKNADNVLLARDRSRYKKHILIVDHYVPHYDKDAGGKCTFMYANLFNNMGFHVTFIGDNFYRHEPYTTQMQQAGIEVIYGNYYYANWKEWIKENGKYYDYAYLNRPHIAPKYIDIIRESSNAKIIYFGHDLHYLREQRRYEIEKDPKILKESKKWKETEFSIFKKSDVIHVVGSYEQAILSKEFPDKPVRNIPLYIYDNILTDIEKDFNKRKDILFVGGFGHNPNIDAVLWFGREIFPKILEKYDDIKWYVVGSKAPNEVMQLASDNIIIKGFVPDQELEKLYRECKMAVVPLRVGAGVKGKVVEAAYYQIPLVTTTIGAEGLSLEENAFAIEDNADKMAELICELYEDNSKLMEFSNNSIDFIEKYFMLEEAKRVITLDVV